MKLKSRRVKLLIFITFLVIVGLAAVWYNQTRRSLPKNAVKLPNSETLVLKNELVILASGQDVESVESVVSGFGGEITVSVPETDTYQAKFPVKNLEELDKIKNELNERGLETVYSYVLRPLRPGAPQ